MVHDAKQGAARTMRFQTAAAEFADGVIAVGRAGDVDLATDAASKPFFPCCRGNAVNIRNLADKFVSGRATECVIASENLNIGIANASKTDAHQRPTWPKLWQLLFRGL